MEIKTKIMVGDKEFSSMEATYDHERIVKAKKAYLTAARVYKDLLNSCTCSEKVFVRIFNDDRGGSYMDEFDNWHNKRVQVEEHACNSCGKKHYYGGFEGKEDHCVSGGNFIVKTGVF